MARLLVGYDGSPPSRRALEHAVEKARQAGHELVLLTVIPPQVRRSSLAGMMPAGLELPAEMSHTFEETARLRLEELAEALKGSGIKVRAEVRAGDTAAEFLRAAEEVGATEIVIGQKSYAPHQPLGPNARAIHEGAKVPVTMVQ